MQALSLDEPLDAPHATLYPHALGHEAQALWIPHPCFAVLHQSVKLPRPEHHLRSGPSCQLLTPVSALRSAAVLPSAAQMASYRHAYPPLHLRQPSLLFLASQPRPSTGHSPGLPLAHLPACPLPAPVFPLPVPAAAPATGQAAVPRACLGPWKTAQKVRCFHCCGHGCSCRMPESPPAASPASLHSGSGCFPSPAC